MFGPKDRETMQTIRQNNPPEFKIKEQNTYSNNIQEKKRPEELKRSSNYTKIIKDH